MFFKGKKKEKEGPVLVASILPAFSGMYGELLKENNIPFLCKQQGSGGYLRIVTSGLLVPDNYYVNKEDYEKAMEIYHAFIESEVKED